MNRNFTLKIDGTVGENVLPSEINAPGGALQKAWKNFLRELYAQDIIVSNGVFDHAGKTITLPAETKVAA